MTANKYFAVAITRTCGSGGYFIGRNLAEDYAIDLYDRKLLWLASEDSGISEAIFAGADENTRKRLLYRVARHVYNGEIIPPESGEHIRNYVPYTAPGECNCGCGGGILAASCADSIITATCSDWGCYGLMAALSYLKKDMEILHREETESELMRVAARSGLIDMTGSLLPGIDGFNTRMNVGVVSLMRQCTAYAVRYSSNSEHWFEPVLAKRFFG